MSENFEMTDSDSDIKGSARNDIVVFGKSTTENGAEWTLIELDLSGKILHVNSSIETLLEIPVTLAKQTSFQNLLKKIVIESYFSRALADFDSVINLRTSQVKFIAEVRLPKSAEIKLLQFQFLSGWLKPDRITAVLTDITSDKLSLDSLDDAKLRSVRLVDYGKLIILRTDLNFKIIDAVGDTKRILGISIQELIHNSNSWMSILNTQDFRRLRQKVISMHEQPREFEQELEIHNPFSKQEHEIMLTMIPIFKSSGEHEGWEGVGFDITEKRQTEKKLVRQSNRIEALYEITRNLQANIDPAYVALRGVKALMQATKSVSGYCVLYDRNIDQMELVATVGCSKEYVDGLSQIMNKSNMSRHVIGTKQGLLIDDIRKHALARYGLAEKEGLRSCIVMPLLYEDPDEGTQVVGALQIASRRVARYDQEDFELVQTATKQIALAIRQAEYYANEKREASSVAVLYKLSHALTRVREFSEICEYAFPVILGELSCKRLWLGVMSEQGSHIVGSGAYGPGLGDDIAHLQIELDLRHDFLDEAIKTKRAVIVPSGAKMECSGLNRIVARLKIGAFVVVPLVSLGQVVGILFLEPTLASTNFLNRKLGILTSIANEMGTVILARRFENRIASSEKMRMAGLLASGVAHNFNNLLQAVMGQASLIEMQLPSDSPLKSSASTINEAATRGAQLIKQMLSISNPGKAERKICSLNELLHSGQELYRSLLGTNSTLQFNLTTEDIFVSIEPGQIQQVLSHLVMNSRDAMQNKSNGKVEIITKVVRLRTGEVDPELAPGEYIRLDFKDNGRGMSKDQLARCFEPFFTSKNNDFNTGLAFDGAGFGLSLSYSILKQHGGIMLARSEVDKGTEFNLYFPIVYRESKIEGINSTNLLSKNLKKQAIIMNQESNVPLAIQATLDSIGLTTRIISDPTRAYEQVEQPDSEVKLLIIDLDEQPAKIQQDLLRLQNKNKDIKFLLISSNSTVWKDAFKNWQGLAIVDKPLGVWAIHNNIRKLLYGENLSDAIEADVSSAKESALLHEKKGDKYLVEKKQTDEE